MSRSKSSGVVMGFSLFNKPYDLYNYKGISEVMIAQNDGSANGCLSVNIKTGFLPENNS